jgi:ABC-type branched-subunit amino acid transport system ATPase component
VNVLEARRLEKSYGGVRALAGCSFAVRAHTVTALIGPNGAGKTTAFNCLSGLTVLDRGAVSFRGRDVTALPAWRRSRLGLSRTFQASRVFRNLSVRQNLTLAIRQDDDLFWRMLWRGRAVDVSALDAAMTSTLEFVGLRVPLDTPATSLSYGQQKLFDLARALLNPHSALLLDEPVAGVNPVLRDRLKEIVVALKRRAETVLLIEHDMDFVRAVADHVIVMDQGAVLVEGEPERVLADQRVLDAYLGPV